MQSRQQYWVSSVRATATVSQCEGYPKLDSSERSRQTTGGYFNWPVDVESQSVICPQMTRAAVV